MTIPLAHDFLCPWCWIGLQQVIELKNEWPDIEFDWQGYELMPEELAWPEPAPKAEPDPKRPPTPSRLDLAYAAAGMEAPTAVRPKRMRSHNALEAAEYAKEQGVGQAFIEKLYRAFWEDGKEINDLEVLRELAEGILPDIQDLIHAVKERRYYDKIVKFDDDAYDAGIYNVPTFIINGERYAEQPTVALRKAVAEAHSKVAV